MAEKIQFETNVPVTCALKYADGKRVDSDYNEYEVYYSTVDGRCFYAGPFLAEKIAALGLTAREEFTICKKEVRNGGGKARIEWQVSRQVGEQPGSASVAPVEATQKNSPAPNGPIIRSQDNPPVKIPMDRAMTAFLVLAGRATRDAEKTLGAEGGSVRFDSRDVCALATTCFIQAARAGWLTWVSYVPGTSGLPEDRTSPIDLGGNPPNTQAAADHVAAGKIANLQAKPAASAEASFPSKRGEIKQAFAEVRELVGEVRWQQELEALQIADPLELKYLDRMREFYRHLLTVAKEAA
jgi:hypothetical protein